jgi:hypothetical protein
LSPATCQPYDFLSRDANYDHGVLLGVEGLCRQKYIPEEKQIEMAPPAVGWGYSNSISLLYY